MTHTLIAPAWTLPRPPHSCPQRLSHRLFWDSSRALQLQVTSHPPPLLLVLLIERYHPQPNPSPAPLALSPEHFRNHSVSSCPSPAALARNAFLSHPDGVSSLSPRIRPFWPLASSSWAAISPTLGRQPLWGLIPCPPAGPGLSMHHECLPRGGGLLRRCWGPGRRCWAHAQLRSVGTSAPRKGDAPASHWRWVGCSGSRGRQHSPSRA